MTFPVQFITVTDNYNRLRQFLANLQDQCVSFQARVAGGVDPAFLLGILTAAVALRGFIASLSAGERTALATRYQLELGNPSFDFASNSTAMNTALVAMVNAIRADYPKDASNHPLDRTVDAQGNTTPINITSANLPTCLLAITNWLATLG